METLLQDRREMTSAKKILLIDDDRELLENLSEILGISGYLVTSAPGGFQGVERAIKEMPDLIICDIEMPDLDGYGVFQVLNRHPSTNTVPFIFLSGQYMERSHMRKAMGMGADDYLLKPVAMYDFLWAIEMRLKKSADYSRNPPFTASAAMDLKFDFSDLITSRENSRKYKRRHLLYPQGEKFSHVHFVVSGKLLGFLTGNDGKELITNLYTAGDFVGYTSVWGDSGYSENVKVQEDSELLLIPKSDFENFLNDYSSATASLLRTLSRRIKEKEERMLNLAYSSLRKKAALGIINIMDKFQDEDMGQPVIRLSKEDLARLIGAPIESILRILKEFQVEKIIEMRDGGIYILDHCKLRNLKQ